MSMMIYILHSFLGHNRDSSKSESRCESRATHDEDARRSRSLDGEATLCSSVTRHLDKVNGRTLAIELNQIKVKSVYVCTDAAKQK